MRSTSRLSEKWFGRGLWLIALIFCFFLIGLGSKIIHDLPQVESSLTLDYFIDQKLKDDLLTQLDNAKQESQIISKQLDQAEQEYRHATDQYKYTRETFDNWIRTRVATQDPKQDVELIKRNQEIEYFKQLENNSRTKYEQARQDKYQAQQNINLIDNKITTLSFEAREPYQEYRRSLELRVFLYRLTFTLPLLVIAGLLFVYKRKSSWWPFVWGFVWFAGFVFFVELVPYLPDYGGYVRYSVGIIATLIIGRAAIIALNRYLAQQKKQESLPEAKRREVLNYDKVLARLAQNICPGCERTVDFSNNETNFCRHCGITFFDICPKCNVRKNAFANFCHACGTPKTHHT